MSNCPSCDRIISYESPADIVEDIPKVCPTCEVPIIIPLPEEIPNTSCPSCEEEDLNVKPPLPEITRIIRYETEVIERLGDINRDMINNKKCRNVNDYNNES